MRVPFRVQVTACTLYLLATGFRLRDQLPQIILRSRAPYGSAIGRGAAEVVLSAGSSLGKWQGRKVCTSTPTLQHKVLSLFPTWGCYRILNVRQPPNLLESTCIA